MVSFQTFTFTIDIKNNDVYDNSWKCNKNNKFMKNIDHYILGQRQKVTTKQNERKFYLQISRRVVVVFSFWNQTKTACQNVKCNINIRREHFIENKCPIFTRKMKWKIVTNGNSTTFFPFFFSLRSCVRSHCRCHLCVPYWTSKSKE